MDRHEEIELMRKVDTIIERVDGLPCRSNAGCGWNIKQKAVAGGGITGALAALAVASYTLISGGK